MARFGWIGNRFWCGLVQLEAEFDSVRSRLCFDWKHILALGRNRFRFDSESILAWFRTDFGSVLDSVRNGFGCTSVRTESARFSLVRCGALGTVRFGSESFLVQNRSRFASEPTSVRSRFRFAPEPIFVRFGLFRFGSVWRRIRYKR